MHVVHNSLILGHTDDHAFPLVLTRMSDLVSERASNRMSAAKRAGRAQHANELAVRANEQMEEQVTKY